MKICLLAIAIVLCHFGNGAFSQQQDNAQQDNAQQDSSATQIIPYGLPNTYYFSDDGKEWRVKVEPGSGISWTAGQRDLSLMKDIQVFLQLEITEDQQAAFAANYSRWQKMADEEFGMIPHAKYNSEELNERYMGFSI